MSAPDASGRYDLAIVGSGGAGFAAAIAARDRGLRVVIVERGVVGGTCVNVGCIPSKALLAAADARHRAAEERFPGVLTQAAAVDFAAVIAGKREIVDALQREKYVDLAAEYGFAIISGDARFVEGPALDVDGRCIDADHYLIATGAAPLIADVAGLSGSGYLTSTSAMELQALPTSLVVLGGGPVALEQAQMFSRLGSRVTILVRSRLAREEEPEIAEGIRAAVSAEGITIAENATVRSVRRENEGFVVTCGDDEHRAEQLLVATGRRPATETLGLEAVGVDRGPDGHVIVDDELRTSHPRIWAAGDVTGHPQFVYVAARHGSIVVENAFDGARRRVDYAALPRIVFTAPTIAAAGLTEAQAIAAGLEVESRVLPMEAVPRAIVSRSTRGLVKLVAERGSGRVLGVHLLADGAGDAILAAVYAIQAGLTVTQLAASWNPYLTAGEAIHLVAQSFSRDPAMLSCCAG